MSGPEVRILIAQNDGLFREGLCALLEEQPGFFVVGEAHAGNDVLRLVTPPTPDILLLATRIETEQASEALRSGACAILLKHSAGALLFKCIRAVMEGQHWFPGNEFLDIAPVRENGLAMARINSLPAKYGLTKREIQVLSLVIAGLKNREIAKRFSISEQTVKHHMTNIYDKLGVYNRLELALFAVCHGIPTKKTPQ